MLGKLIKHELKSIGRILLPFYLILVALTSLTKLVSYIDIFDGILNFIPVTVNMAYIISLIATLATIFFIIITRFYKNLLSDEGYLMFTLPVKASSLIASKFITSLISTLVGIAAISVSLIIAYYDYVIKFVNSMLDLISTEFGHLGNLLIAELIINLFVGIIYYILLVYLSMAIGQQFCKHKILASIVAFLINYYAIQIILLIGAFIVWFFFSDIVTNAIYVPKLILPAVIICNILLSVVFFAGTNIILSKKLNLE